MFPTVDVIIPVFNAERFVRTAVMSALSQSYPVRRVIVVNDASTDRTGMILASIHHPKLQIVSHTTNRGEAAARNTGLRSTNADFVGFLDADDIWACNKIERQLHVFNHTTVRNCGVVYCDFTYVDEYGIPFPGRKIPPRFRGTIFPQLIKGNCISGSASAVLIRQACIAQIENFDERLIYGADWDYWLRCAAKFGFDFVDEPLVQIRVHNASIQRSLSRSRKLRRLSDLLTIVRKWSEGQVLPTRYYNNFRFEALELSTRRRKWTSEFHAILNRLAKIDPAIKHFNVYSWIYIFSKLAYVRLRRLVAKSQSYPSPL